MTPQQAMPASQPMGSTPSLERSSAISAAENSGQQSADKRALRRPMAWLHSKPLLAWMAVAASLIGCQALVASGLNQPRITVMLPFGPGDDRLRQQFLRGFTVGEETVKACGSSLPRTSWFGLSPDASPVAALARMPDQQLVVAPPTADLRAFDRLAVDRKLSVLLPFQRGESLGVLRGLEGRQRLWPLVPSRRKDLEAIAKASVNNGWGWAMVIADPDSLASSDVATFVEAFLSAGGAVKSYTAEDVQIVDPADDKAFERLSDDILWSRVPTIVVAADPDGPLVKRLRARQAEGRFGTGLKKEPNWIWLSDATQIQDLEQQAWQQLGLDHPARGDGWSSFAEAYEKRWGESPHLLEAAAFDTARILALSGAAPLPVSKEGSLDAMGWVDPEAKPVSICEGLKLRQQGKTLRVKAAASDFTLRGGEAPSGSALAGLIKG